MWSETVNVLTHVQDIPCADKMMADVVTNISLNGICKHLAHVFVQGEGLQGPI